MGLETDQGRDEGDLGEGEGVRILRDAQAMGLDMGKAEDVVKVVIDRQGVTNNGT